MRFPSLRRRFNSLISKPAPQIELGKLVCGRGDTSGIAKTALTQLSTSINDFSRNLERYYANPASQDALRFSSFCSRAALENAAAAILGRLDCFRLLYLSEFQAQPEYDHEKRAFSSFSWFGDVIPDEKPAPDLWTMEQNATKISRALLSKHSEHVYPYGLTADMLARLRNAGFATVGLAANASDEQLDEIYLIGPAKIRRIRDVIYQAIWM